jgi:SNF2 family DNA or RNA helicase
MNIISIVHSRKKKIIIFSDFLNVQTTLSKKIGQFLNEETIIINGSTKDTSSMVKKFSDSNDTVLIASPKVAGAGLNITCANYIIFFNMMFNEGQLNQAKKRAHRIGQKDIVFCYYLYYKDSIESEYYNKRIPNKKQIQKAAEKGYKI